MKCRWEGCTASEPEDMKEHAESHVKGLTTFQCLWEGCPRNKEVLSNKYALQAHMRIHTGDKPFKCPKCQKCFSRADALNKHMKRHEAEEKQLERAVGMVAYGCECRDNEEETAQMLLEERQFQIDCLRVLQDELLLVGIQEDTWDDYLV